MIDEFTDDASRPSVGVAPGQGVVIRVERGDVLDLRADVLLLKFAQGLHGADRVVTERLAAAGAVDRRALPRPGDVLLVDGKDSIGARKVLYVGTPPLGSIEYQTIREFSRTALAALLSQAPSTRHVCATIHGPGFGLDEGEAFRAQLAGFLDAIVAGEAPPALDRITIVEQAAPRVGRLGAVLRDVLPDNGTIARPAARAVSRRAESRLAEATGRALHTLRDVGAGSVAKRHAFVAMPFAEAFDDTFHYGISAPVRDTGLLCERADLSAFTGDVLTWVKGRIDTASVLIADLTTANPNVYLELGYAWGRGVPTVLTVTSESDLTFDTRGQRCLVYGGKIKRLEELLRHELARLHATRSA
jgi:hypothetical protein